MALNALPEDTSIPKSLGDATYTLGICAPGDDSAMVITKGEPTMAAPDPVSLIIPNIWKYELSLGAPILTQTHCISNAIILPGVSLILPVVAASV